MKKIIDWFRRFWKWIVAHTTTKDFVLAFPFAAFAVGAVFLHSVIMFLAMIVWLIPLILGIREEE